MTAVVPSGFAHVGDEFDDFVLSYRYTAYRLETQDNYAAHEELDHVANFVAGRPDDDSWMDDWLGMIVRRTAAGQQMTRVRVVSRPWSDYTRYGLHLSRLNVAAGEDIRYLDREAADRAGLPTYDYWLIDSRRMCILRHNDADELLGADIIDDPAAVVEHCYYRDVALQVSMPRADYLRE